MTFPKMIKESFLHWFLVKKNIDILIKEANAKKNWNQSQNFGLKKVLGAPFLQNIIYLKKSAISIHYELR